ncbi:MAG TPA: hypothetical protein VNU71_02920, partial [Burkholderiaceae bacterium]|nr:hypothetical protein [Burkholderiaceae bacterium]
MSLPPSRAARAMLGAALAALAFAAAALDAPPKAPSQPVADTYFGVKVADPYRNLEDLKSPATRGWLDAQGAYTAEVLKQIDGRDAIAKRVAELGKASGDAVDAIRRMPGERIYYLRRQAGENQMKLVMRIGLAGAERVLVDPEQMAKQTGVPHAINYFVPSWDGKTLAYGVSAGGSEDASLYLMDIATGKPIGTPIPRVHEGLVHWTPDSRRLSYNQLRALPPGAADTETYLDSTVYVIAPRERAAAPRALFGPLVNTELKLDRLDVAGVSFAPGSRWMIARTTDTTSPEGRLYVAPLAQLGQAKIAWRQISSFADKITEVGLRGDTLYLRTYA